MSGKIQSKPFQLTVAVVVRLLLFAIIVSLVIWYLASAKTSASVLGQNSTTDLTNQIYQMIPAEKRQQLENLSSNPGLIPIQKKIQYLNLQLEGFPTRQLDDLKKAILKNMAKDLLKSLDDDGNR